MLTHTNIFTWSDRTNFLVAVVKFMCKKSSIYSRKTECSLESVVHNLSHDRLSCDVPNCVYRSYTSFHNNLANCIQAKREGTTLVTCNQPASFPSCTHFWLHLGRGFSPMSALHCACGQLKPSHQFCLFFFS